MVEVAVSPVVRVGAEVAPRGRSARLLAAAAVQPSGPALVTVLCGVVVEELDDVDRVVLLQCWERAARWVAARHADAVVGVAGRVPRDRDDTGREHVRVALVGQGGSARACVDTARALAGPLAAARGALARGEVSEAHVRVLAAETAHLSEPLAREVTARVLPAAAGRPPSRLRRAVRRAVLAADPAGAQEAADRAGQARRVERWVQPDSQASLTVTGPAVEVTAIWTALDLRAARASATDPRTLDQRRFDALVDLAAGADVRTDLSRAATGPAAAGPGPAAGPMPAAAADAGPAGRPAGAPRPAARPGRVGRRRGVEPTVHLHADAATWAGLAEEPVELTGYGPIPAGTARDLWASSTWRAVVADAVSGVPLAVSGRGYRPGAALDRLLAARDRDCQFPGCTAAVWHCDADHGTPHGRGGATSAGNLRLLCRRHHRLKTHSGWSWQAAPDGATTWTDPHGRSWTRPPDPPPGRDPRPPEPPPPSEARPWPDEPPF